MQREVIRSRSDDWIKKKKLGGGIYDVFGRQQGGAYVYFVGVSRHKERKIVLTLFPACGAQVERKAPSPEWRDLPQTKVRALERKEESSDEGGKGEKNYHFWHRLH